MNSKKLLLYASLRSVWRLEIYRNLYKKRRLYHKMIVYLSINIGVIEEVVIRPRQDTLGLKP